MSNFSEFLFELCKTLESDGHLYKEISFLGKIC